MSNDVDRKVEEIRAMAQSLLLLADSSTLPGYKMRLFEAAGRLIEEAETLKSAHRATSA